MKVVALQDADLHECLKDARHKEVVITDHGKPIGVVMRVEGLDLEQIELGHSDKFWKLVRKWRRQKTISRAELDKRLSAK
jgi:prevent-host-death family protein